MTLPPVLRTPAELARHREKGVLGLVPTMGALHDGHESLIRLAAECDTVMVSIFVNPAQFNNPADLERYPRRLELDRAFAGDAGATAIYAPEATTIYPEGHATLVSVSGITERWEGKYRPRHFDGVATVVAILLNQVRPDRSYFGEKDWQQLAMIRRLAADLALPGDIIGCPIIRDADGLALSSRNARLSDEEGAMALAIPNALMAMRDAVGMGETDTSALRKVATSFLNHGPDVQVEYLAVVDPDTLEPVETVRARTRVLIAAWVGSTRLIDTMDLTCGNESLMFLP